MEMKAEHEKYYFLKKLKMPIIDPEILKNDNGVLKETRDKLIEQFYGHTNTLDNLLYLLHDDNSQQTIDKFDAKKARERKRIILDIIRHFDFDIFDETKTYNPKSLLQKVDELCDKTHPLNYIIKKDNMIRTIFDIKKAKIEIGHVKKETSKSYYFGIIEKMLNKYNIELSRTRGTRNTVISYRLNWRKGAVNIINNIQKGNTNIKLPEQWKKTRDDGEYNILYINRKKTEAIYLFVD